MGLKVVTDVRQRRVFGPSVTTWATGMSVLTDMNPRTLKTTTPPKMLVAQLMTDAMTASLHNHNISSHIIT